MNNNSIPKTLEETFPALLEMLSSEQVALYQHNPSPGMFHFYLARTIRNNWGLWKKSELYQDLASKGLEHPDDMSEVILTSFHHFLNSESLKLEEQVKVFQDYWKTYQYQEAWKTPEE